MIKYINTILWIAFILGIVALVLHAKMAKAHDHDNPGLNNWYQGLHSGKGLCCDGSDAVHVADPDWETKDGHYRVRLDGRWIDVPPEAVIDNQPNISGHTLVWPYKGAFDITYIRCFMPGTMS